MAKADKKQPWLKFYPSDWSGDRKLHMCSIGARGLWVEMMCVMHEAEPYGHLVTDGKPVTSRQIASLAGISLSECGRYLAELESAGVYSRTETKTIFSRRMVRDKARAEKAREDGSDGGNPEIRRGTVPKEQRSRPYKRSDAPQKTLRIFQRSDGKCHWCSVDLIFEPDGSSRGFHVDHVLPICDGGTNDEDNLVAACADCNHKRARNSSPTQTYVAVGNNSDTKPYIPESRDHSPESISKTRERDFSLSKDFNENKKRPIPIDDRYQPSDAAIEYAYSLKMTKADFDLELSKFRARSISLGTVSLDPDQNFKIWCDRWLAFKTKNEPPAPVTTPAAPFIDKVFVVFDTPGWKSWVAYLKRVKNKNWSLTVDRDNGEGRTQTGWWWPTEFAPGYDEATGEFHGEASAVA